MSKSDVENLKNRIFSKDSDLDESGLTPVIELAKGLGCLPELVGRDYEVLDSFGKLVYTIRQKPISIKLLKTLLEEYNKILKMENDRENAKWGSKSSGKPSMLNRGGK